MQMVKCMQFYGEKRLALVLGLFWSVDFQISNAAHTIQNTLNHAKWIHTYLNNSSSFGHPV